MTVKMGETGGRSFARKPLTAALGLLLGLAMGSPWQQASAQGAVHAYSMPSQALGASLNQLAITADRQILVPPELVRGRMAPALSGRHTIDEALKRLLAGSGLTYRIGSSGVITITIVAKPAPSARKREAPGSVEAAPPKTDPVDLDAVMVTGSRLRRTDYEGASPVISIDRAQIDRTGAATVRELIGTLPQASVSMDESGTNTFLGASTIQLRGLSYGSTLILINGRRVNASSSQASRNFFDLNSIPLEAIDRVEILTDTASAIYGGDAIGGAVNFILRRDFEGAVVTNRYGTSYKGDGDETAASLTLGGSSERFDGLLVFELFDRDPIYKTARKLTSSDDFTRYGGPDQRSTTTYPGNIYALPGAGNLPGLQHPFAGVPVGSDGIGLSPADFAATDGVLNRVDLAGYSALVPDSKRAGVMANARYRIDPDTSLFGEFMHSKNEQRIEFAPDLLNGGAVGLFVVPAENPFNPFGVDVGVDYRFTELGPRQNAATNEFTRALVGAEGLVGSAQWQVSLLADRDKGMIVNRNFIDRASVQQYLDLTDPATALNVFSSTGSNNPETLAAITGETTDHTESGATMLEASFSGDWTVFGGRSLSYAVGVSSRREFLEWRMSDTSIDADRDINAAFVELMLPLLRGDSGKRLELSFAGRHDDYSDFGGSFNPQVGLLWKPTPSLLLRASAGTAFKAPSMYDLYAPLTVNPTAVVNDPLRNDELAQVDFRLGGNPDVKPEQAESVTIGFIWEPQAAPGFSFGANALRVKQEDFITRFFDFQLFLENPQLFGDRIHRAPQTPEDIENGLPGRLLGLDGTTLNFGEVVVRGIDLQSRYAFDAGRWGDFVWTVNGSYIDSFKVVLLPGDAPSEQVGHANRAGYPVKFKGSTALQWNSNGGLSTNLQARYLHSYLDYDGVRRLPSQWWLDAQAAYDFGRAGVQSLDGLSATLGIINLTNNQGRFSNNFSGYDFQQDDLRGRFFYLSLKYAF